MAWDNADELAKGFINPSASSIFGGPGLQYAIDSPATTIKTVQSKNRPAKDDICLYGVTCK
jgi:hypothetical protein